jgi:hypothetical protein
MNPLPTRYALMRDRTHWDGVSSGLAFDADGVASLLPIPAPPQTVALPGPFGVLPSGVACVACASAFVSDTAHHQVVYVDGLCHAQARIPPVAKPGSGIGEFDEPRGIVFAPGRGLYVADSGNARIVLLRDPTLEPVAILTAGLAEPRALALDSAGRLYVVDGPAGKLLRFFANGTPDAVYAAAMASAGVAARFIAVAADDTLYASTATGGLLHFDAAGLPLPALAALDSTITAGALAISGELLYAADTTSGALAILDRASGATLATMPRFVGPVTALSACADGVLLVKTGDDGELLRCPLDAVAASGTLEAGPLDAGEKDAWYVALCEAEVSPSAGVKIALYATDVAAAVPGPTDWVEVEAASALVANLFPAVAARYLWLRVTLSSADNLATPTPLASAGRDARRRLPGPASRDLSQRGRGQELSRADAGSAARAIRPFGTRDRRPPAARRDRLRARERARLDCELAGLRTAAGAAGRRAAQASASRHRPLRSPMDARGGRRAGSRIHRSSGRASSKRGVSATSGSSAWTPRSGSIRAWVSRIRRG